MKKEFREPDVWQDAGCTECDAPNTAVYGDYNLNMFPSKVRTVWIAPYISVRELKEWFGEPDDTNIGMDMNNEAHIYNREGYSISCSFSNNLVERIDVYKHE